ncbi:PREDICTED: subtilisin-like protease SBT2.2 [Lupinus angustifolius]|uniref:subtilisin-like protease SBT2.2 n=1 Tax=Lupinus angustifolius TaxID=3871 RepID=UPI00092F506F|nr:PREDICTED: subtilisin-like protease SBT2.2 [Lupinus angustifolius]
MRNIYLVLLFCFGMFLLVPCLCQHDSNDATTYVYIVTLKEAPSSHYYSELRNVDNGFKNDAIGRTQFQKPRYGNITKTDKRYAVSRVHDSLLKKVLKGEKYLKLYSYHYLINGFSVLVTQQQAEKLSRSTEVANVALDFSVRTATTHTPQFLGLPRGAWSQEGGFEAAGEGVVIGFVDTGIDPIHPSFSDKSGHPYPVPPNYSGICEVTRDFPSGSCNRKLVGARHFAASAITRGIFNSTQDYASPFDGDGHGTHTASVAAGNHGIPVIVAGHHFGNASGMAPRSHIAVYKALYKSFGGFAADVVAAIDQAAQDGVDIISLSITPNRRPPGIATFFNPIDMALLSAVKAGIFVVQAAGNTGPSPMSMSSFSPWIFTVGAASHDRTYSNSIFLGNNVTIPGVGLAPGTDENKIYKLIHAHHALNNDTTVADDVYVGECQDANKFNKDLVQGNLLICSYSIRFLLGTSSIKQASETVKNLSAAGVVFYLDPFVIGYQLNPVPIKMPGIIIASANDSKILMQYYTSSLEIDAVSKKIVKFGAVASIYGGLKANYKNDAPKVMYYSARGPDPGDNLPHEADILKPNVLAPGNSIWAAWSHLGMDSAEFQGEKFAMMSGTSMAAPHVAGFAALIRQKFPNFSPAAIASALSTTTSLHDKKGGPIMAQRSYASPDLNQSPATPFDMGSGFVNATAALNPGLIFDTRYDDYMSFLCSINGSAPVMLNYTGQNCLFYNSTLYGPDLNLPSITISKLNQSRVVQRTIQNIAANETYRVGWSAPHGVSIKVSPTHFSVADGERQVLSVFFNATINSQVASFGRIGLFGNKGHVVNIPLSVIVKISHNITAS